MNDNDKVTSADLDRFAEEYALRRKRKINDKVNELHILDNMRQDLGSMMYMLKQFKHFESQYLCESLSKSIDEIERIKRNGRS